MARVSEQAAMAAVLVILARRLPVTEFGVVSLVFAFQSMAVTASDFGLGLALLRIPPGTRISRHPLRRIRRHNAVLLAGGALVGAAVAASGHRAGGAAFLLGALLWAASAESYVRKASALRLGEPFGVARSEVLGSLALLAGVVAFGDAGHAALVVGLGFLAKSSIEIVAQGRAIARSFSEDGIDPSPGFVWISQVLSYVIANVDYLLVQLILGSRALGLYSLAFRVTSLIPSQISFVLARVATVDLAALEPHERAPEVRRIVRSLFLAGTVVAALGALLAPFVGDLLGSRWDDAAPLMVLLFVAVPWRLILSVVGINALVQDEARAVCWFEAGRLLFVASMLVAGASISLLWCAAFGSIAAVVASAWGHVVWPMRPAGSPSRILAWAGVGTVVLITGAAVALA